MFTLIDPVGCSKVHAAVVSILLLAGSGGKIVLRGGPSGDREGLLIRGIICFHGEFGIFECLQVLSPALRLNRRCFPPECIGQLGSTLRDGMGGTGESQGGRLWASGQSLEPVCDVFIFHAVELHSNNRKFYNST